MTYQSPVIIINVSAGSTSDVSDGIYPIFEDYGFARPEIIVSEAKNLEAELSNLSSNTCDLLVVYGGDGTCKTGAIKAKDMGVPFIPLPGGTMNVLPKALYDTSNWKDALISALEHNTPQWIPAGYLNDHMFLVAAMIGEPVLMAGMRESVREGAVIDAVKQIPDVLDTITQGTTFTYFINQDDTPYQANAVMMSCPNMSVGATHSRKFELAAAPLMSVAELINIGARTLATNWRDSEQVHLATTSELNIHETDTLDVLLDGEPLTLTGSVTVSLELKGVQVLAPPLNSASDKPK